MKVFNRQIQTGGRNLLPVFFAGMLAGILMIYLGKSTFVENTGLFDADTLSGMKHMTVDSGALFYYVLRKRMLFLAVMAVLATTYLGYAVCVGAAAWFGMASGTFLSVLTLRYGIKGIFLAVVGVFPQYLLYVPAMVLLLGWCESLYRAIYARGGSVDVTDKIFWMKKLGRLGLIGASVALGCLMEGYLNPQLLAAYLKIF